MKTLNLINLHKAEVKKNHLAKIKGGGDIKCYCTLQNPFLATKQSGGPVQLCLCNDLPSWAGVRDGGGGQ
jgi:hypothetical protein